MSTFLYFLVGVVVMKLILAKSTSGLLYKLKFKMEKDLVISTFAVQLLWPAALFVFACLYVRPFIEEVIEKLEQ